MIVKDLPERSSADRLRQAGHDAEAQMAFYLKRAFGLDPAVHVFHDLRLEVQGDAAQIDHLILHRSGAVIVESKSVTTSVRINERDEWARQWNGRWSGMPSPVLQARRQADFLRQVLDADKEKLLGKALFGLKQKTFRAFVIDVVVAISDRGVIQHRGKLPEVRKADQVPDRVRDLITEHTQLAHPLSKDPRSQAWGVTITPEEFVRVSAFLRARHTERPAEQVTIPSVPPEPSTARVEPPPRDELLSDGAASFVPVAPPALPASVPVCRHCGSQDLAVVYGKFGYYWKCGDCDGNTPLVTQCPTCGAKARVRKSGLEFFAECIPCGSSALFHTNAS